MRPPVVRSLIRAALFAALGGVIYVKAPALATWYAPAFRRGESGVDYWHFMGLFCASFTWVMIVRAWRLNQTLRDEERARMLSQEERASPDEHRSETP